MMPLNALSAAAQTVQKIPNGMVVLIGVGTVFVGLISIIIICKITGYFCGAEKQGEPTAPPAAPVQTAKTAVPETIANRGEVVAAITAAIAETEKTDISAIRILSIKKK